MIVITGALSVKASNDSFGNLDKTISASLNNPMNGLFQNKCIASLDCFYTGPPFYHPIYRPISVLPSSELGTEFLLYSREDSKNPQVLKPTEDSFRNSSLDSSIETKILIHGYTVKLLEDDIRFKMKDELLENSRCNVIIVNWTTNSQSPYPQAVANARAVGAQVAKLIKYHVETRHMNIKSVHIIGHSLGGQMSGWIGERVPGLGRITGLDPAGPWFQKAENSVRLDPTDADFVDVIHTNGGSNVVEGLGLDEPIGHLDFYPNGGKDQPGCFYEALQETNGEVNKTTELIANSCDHSRANQYFLDSINRCRFVGVQCSSYSDFDEGRCKQENSIIAEMGFHAAKIPKTDEAMRFYLQTAGQSPFCEQSNEIE